MYLKIRLNMPIPAIPATGRSVGFTAVKRSWTGLSSRKELLTRSKCFWHQPGSTYADIRIDHMKRIRELNLDGYAIGGLAVGARKKCNRIIEAVEPEMPADKPRYLMGVGTPVNILEAVHRGSISSVRHAFQKRPAWTCVYLGGVPKPDERKI